jgi:acyl carrier protein
MSPEPAPIREKLRRFLAAEVFLNRDPASIGDDDDLVSLGLDSLSVLRLVLFLETELGVDLDGEDVLGEKLSTVRRIADHCAAHQK